MWAVGGPLLFSEDPYQFSDTVTKSFLKCSILVGISD